MNISNNTTKLNELLEIADSLPNSGEGNVAKLTLTSTYAINSGSYCTIDKDGNLLYITAAGTYEITVPTIFYAMDLTSSVYCPEVVEGDAVVIDGEDRGCFVYGDCTLNILGERL